MAPGVQMSAKSLPSFRCAVTHGPSGMSFNTEAPKDNGGTGASFSPTDLIGIGLLACALTTMALAASRENLPWGEASGDVEKQMTPPPRRIESLTLKIRMPKELPADLRGKFEEIARGCPVARSLSSDVHCPMTFEYPTP